MRRIPLTQGKFALVDDADFEAVNQFKWCAQKSGRRFYAKRQAYSPEGKRILLFLHSFLLPKAVEIDHIDGDGLNCQRDNLRSATHLQNTQAFKRKQLGTSSKFIGVSWNRNLQKWDARVTVCGRQCFLGYFHSEKDAALAYDAAVQKYFGEFASPNFNNKQNQNNNKSKQT